MVCIGCEDAVMPQKAKVAMMQAHFVNEPLAEEICFVFAEIHVFGIAERVVHNNQRMKGEVR